MKYLPLAALAAVVAGGIVVAAIPTDVVEPPAAQAPPTLPREHPTERPPIAQVATAVSRRVDGLASDLARKLNAEGRDASWSASTERAYSETFDSDERLEGTTLVDVDCRTTMCRLRLEHATEEDRLEFGEHVGWIPGIDQNGILLPQPGHASIVYAARPGHKVPVDEELLRTM